MVPFPLVNENMLKKTIDIIIIICLNKQIKVRVVQKEEVERARARGGGVNTKNKFQTEMQIFECYCYRTPIFQSIYLHTLAERNAQVGVCSEEKKLFIIKLANQYEQTHALKDPTPSAVVCGLQIIQGKILRFVGQGFGILLGANQSEVM